MLPYTYFIVLVFSENPSVYEERIYTGKMKPKLFYLKIHVVLRCKHFSFVL